MARKKVTNQLADPAVIDLDALYDQMIDLQVELLAERDPADFGGHDYAYKCGYAISAVNFMLAVMEGRVMV